jgi:short-subunit dehydrogenase
VKDIDVAMLFLNAGWSKLSKFENLSETEVEAIVTINALQPVYLTKVLLGQM